MRKADISQELQKKKRKETVDYDYKGGNQAKIRALGQWWGVTDTGGECGEEAFQI